MVTSNQSNDKSFKGLWEELQWRGLVAISTDEAELSKQLNAGKLTYYIGFDPTAPSLHLGNLVQLLVMRRLQLAGHNPIVLIGGSTGLVGDPRPTAERVLNTKETVSEWVEKLSKQASRFLDFSGSSKATLVNNLDWTAPLSAIDFLREIGKHFRVGKMLSKEAVSARLNSEHGISYTEFSYQILQGYDFLELFRRHNCTLQLGGSDQWGNLTSGSDLIHKVEGKSVHLLATPLITNSDGKKFGKSEGNAVWLDAELTSAYAFYQFWLNVEDADVIDRLKVFTFLSKSEIEALAEQVKSAPHLREAQRALALEVTSLVHSPEAANGAIQASKALFGQAELTDLSEQDLLSALSELPNVKAAKGASIAQLLVDTGLEASVSAGRRAIKEGGVYLNNEKVVDEAAVFEQVLPGNVAVLRRGKKTLAAIYLS
ncbi:MAG: tyrosine--tRNA ligase [Actinobacteria bacterium]|uniref:tyrosine--tRNA ligase n=1 Tax=freshwater metagenome TaxID=449393 RepID=A0A6J6JAK3_9ZZZZ|nr:tyrosine--tRNA ligase [Actinomycetota bacterium]